MAELAPGHDRVTVVVVDARGAVAEVVTRQCDSDDRLELVGVADGPDKVDPLLSPPPKLIVLDHTVRRARKPIRRGVIGVPAADLEGSLGLAHRLRDAVPDARLVLIADGERLEAAARNVGVDDYVGLGELRSVLAAVVAGL